MATLHREVLRLIRGRTCAPNADDWICHGVRKARAEIAAYGRVKPEELETEKAARAADTAEILALAHTLTIQFLNGKHREIEYIDCNLFECWERLRSHMRRQLKSNDRKGLSGSFLEANCPVASRRPTVR